MKIETELKFPVDQFGPVLDKLRQTRSEHTPWYFEQNIVLDDEKSSLKKKDCLLRLRTGLISSLTLKLPVKHDRHGIAKNRQEYETVLDNIQDMEQIFMHLGFKTRLRYEKFRQIWNLDTVEICLDILPFGRFVEIEGPEISIMDTVGSLGLELDFATAKTYHELKREYAVESGSHSGDDFVFARHEIESIARELNIPPERYRRLFT